MNGNKWDAFSVTEYKDRENKDATRWNRIGAAFDNRDGSITVLLDSLPVNGKLQLRRPEPKDDDRRRDSGDTRDRSR